MTEPEYVDYFINQLQDERHFTDKQLAQAFTSDSFIACVADMMRRQFPRTSTAVIGDDSISWAFRDHKITRRKFSDFWGPTKLSEFALITREQLITLLVGYGSKAALHRVDQELDRRGIRLAADTSEATSRMIAYYGNAELIPVRMAFYDDELWLLISWLGFLGISNLGDLTLRNRGEMESARLRNVEGPVFAAAKVDLIEGVLARFGLSFWTRRMSAVDFDMSH